MANISDTRYACQVASYMSTTLDNKIYITGGYNMVCNATATGCVNDTSTSTIANNDLLVVDFTQTFTWDSRRIGTRTRMPPRAPDVRWGTLWGVGGKLYQFGGDTDGPAAETLTGEPAPRPRPSVGRSVWEYDIATGVWEETQPRTEWGGVVEPVTQGADACGGGDICYLLLGRTETEMQYNGSLLAYNVKDRLWLDMSDVKGTTMERVYGAEMVYVEALDMLVVIGGVVVASNLPRSLNIINLFDIRSKTWYTVEAKEDVGPRTSFCAAAVSAEDGSSHNIFIFGGTDPKEPIPPPSAGPVNMWVLTMPAFQYIGYAWQSPARERFSCTIIDKQYLVPFGGYYRAGDPKVCNTSLREGLMWDTHAGQWTSLYQSRAGMVQEKPVFKVPEKVVQVIGGTSAGGADYTQPKGGFFDARLKAIFDEAVVSGPTGIGNEGKTEPNQTEPNQTKPDGQAEKAAPTGAIAGGVVGGIAAVVVILLVVWWLRRRRNKSSASPVQVDEPELSYNGGTEQQPLGHEETTSQEVQTQGVRLAGELDGWQKYEIGGSTPVVELQGSELVVEEGKPRWQSR